ncbi:MAG: hypothetical protein UW11_C0011G0016 [Parcubacteria group bacterium GW2011_GWA2_43_9b]|nr:MAG: hypothetical protein UW11_C0011G0016 [Parcubacteria group bacterium GW2011_GWA2_43_9b]
MPAAGNAAEPMTFLSKLKNKFSAGIGGGRSVSLSKVKDTALRLGTIFGGVILAIVLLLWASLALYEKSLNSQINALKKKQAAVFTDKDIDMAAKIVAFDKGALLVQGLLKSHFYTSNLFDKLAAATLPRVQWQSFDMSTKDKTINVNGLAADYSSLAKQILALKEGGFSNAKISNISLDKTGRVGFSASFNFDPQILQK